MKIALFGATGMVGSRIAAEATARGHQVTTLSRATGADLADADSVRRAAADHDVVVSATGPSRTGAPSFTIVQPPQGVTSMISPTAISGIRAPQL